jgi:hypothetical protein
MTTKPKTNRRLASGLKAPKRVTEASLSREIAEGAKFFWSSRGGNPNAAFCRPQSNSK